MRISDRFAMALRNLWRRKSRTILTILSVVIGSTSIILMLAFAEGISVSQRQMIESFQGLATINIYDENSHQGMKIDDKMINELKRIDHVKAVVPSKSVYSTIRVADNDEYNLEGSLIVVPDEIFKLIDKEMLEWGNVPSPAEDNKIILGKQAEVMQESFHGDYYSYEPVEDFDFKGHDYMVRLGFQDETEEDDGVNFGKEEQIDDPNANKPSVIDVPVEITGKLNNSSFLDGWGSYMSEATYNKLKKEDSKLMYPSFDQQFDEQGNPIPDDGKLKFDNIQVIADDTENVGLVENEIRQLGYNTQSMADTTREIEGQSKTIMLILGGIGSIAFIVSAIGIINTMLMSIYERQKEIGVMKVIGASVSDVQNMFLIESGFIGFFGGVLGLIISLLIGNLINNLFAAGGENMFGSGNIVVIPVWLMLVGVGFSALVGVLAGYLPARRATKLSAIDALRAN